MPTGKCPKCEKVMPYLRLEPIEAKQPYGSSILHSVSYSCPMCLTVISVQADPVALMTDTVNKIKG